MYGYIYSIKPLIKQTHTAISPQIKCVKRLIYFLHNLIFLVGGTAYSNLESFSIYCWSIGIQVCENIQVSNISSSNCLSIYNFFAQFWLQYIKHRPQTRASQLPRSLPQQEPVLCSSQDHRHSNYKILK